MPARTKPARVFRVLEAALGDGGEGFVDLVDIVDHQTLDQHEDQQEQRQKNNGLHGCGNARRHISGKAASLWGIKETMR